MMIMISPRKILNCREGDIIQVISRLESSRWDDILNGIQGWFPSNHYRVLDNEWEEEDDDDANTIEKRIKTADPGDFWIPQATPDGTLFYYNITTGESSMELPIVEEEEKVEEPDGE